MLLGQLKLILLEDCTRRLIKFADGGEGKQSQRVYITNDDGRWILYNIIDKTMEGVPSQGISKSILVVTPLFLVVLAVLHSSSQLSYLFILKFINNVAGSSDITFLPSMQPQVTHSSFQHEDIMNAFSLKQSPASAPALVPQASLNTSSFPIPLLDMGTLRKWAEENPLVKGVSPRWLIPTRVGNTDTILLVVDVDRENEIGTIPQGSMPALESKQVALEQLLSHKLGVGVGDVVSINMKLRNFPNGLKLFQKFQAGSSDQEYQMDGEALDDQQLSSALYDLIAPLTNAQINQTEFARIFSIVFNSEVNAKYKVKKTYYPSGIYPSAISNVILMEVEGFISMLAQWAAHTITDVNEQTKDIADSLPPQYLALWPRNTLQVQSAVMMFKSQLKIFFRNFSLMAVCRLNDREQVYQPHSSDKYIQFAALLEDTPPNMEVIVIYPFFAESLAIKYFFDSVIQIFEFVTCIIYFYTMNLIMKQIYEEKEVEVGIWRTLGAGAVPPRKSQPLEIELRGKSLQPKSISYRSQFEQAMPVRHQLKFLSKLMVKVGYLYYWIATTLGSVLLYMLLKVGIYGAICSKLGFGTIRQPFINLVVLALAILSFILVLVWTHLHRIYTDPLSETIKPVKRTFDVVKVRVIHIATFGVSTQVLLVAVMLVYYGVISYYWIPYAVIDGQDDLQVLLFNTIFLFMIFGAIILLGILQPRIETAIFTLLFRASHRMQSMRLAILKNIKAKQYKNIKVTIIISIIFAFVLFFTAGIKIQMQIVQSFIERALGSTLVFENYEKNTFNTTAINQFLSKQQGIEYCWLSKNLNRGNASISLVSHISKQKITPEIQVLSPSYLNSTFFEYYFPEKYLSDSSSYSKLPNSILDGFNSIYTDQGSVGRYNASDTITEVDPFKILVESNSTSQLQLMTKQMAPMEQVVDLVVSSGLRKKLGVNVGDYYKLRLANNKNPNITYELRARIVHSFKAGPGFDLLGEKAFMSEQQALYIYNTLGIDENVTRENEKLFIKGKKEALKSIGPAIVTMSPERTQMFEIQFVSQSFSLLATYLNAYIVLITGVMSALLTIFIFLYTVGKCRQEAEMYKMLRAIGLSAANIRIMVFSEIIIRLVVATVGGILLGVGFSIGFSLQIEEFLMINTPPMDITVVTVIGLALTLIFSVTIIRATRYIAERSVAETNKI